MFNFPRFGMLRTGETFSHVTVTGAMRVGDATVVIDLIRSKLDEALPFLIASVKTDDQTKTLWVFKGEGWHGVGRLALANDEPVIALIGNGMEGKVERIVLLSDILRGTKTNDSHKMLTMKRAAAEYLGLGFKASYFEQVVSDTLARRTHLEEVRRRQTEAEQERAAAALKRSAAAEAARRANEAEREQREAARKARITRIMARSTISGNTADGKRRHGIPVTKDEWMVLSDETFAMLVNTYDDKTHHFEGLSESFMVSKKGGGNPKMLHRAVVKEDKAVVGARSMPAPVGKALVERSGTFIEVDVYAARSDLDKLQAGGLNGGTPVAIPTGKKSGEKQSVQLYEMHTGKIKQVGQFDALIV